MLEYSPKKKRPSQETGVFFMKADKLSIIHHREGAPHILLHLSI